LAMRRSWTSGRAGALLSPALVSQLVSFVLVSFMAWVGVRGCRGSQAVNSISPTERNTLRYTLIHVDTFDTFDAFDTC